MNNNGPAPYERELPPGNECSRIGNGPRKAKSADEFGEVDTKFVWYPYIPAGDYTVLMSPGGSGKTYFVCGIAAEVSSGRALPGDLKPKGPGNVLIISAEDPGELLKLRLKASGADLKRVFVIDCRDSAGMDFTDGYEAFKATVKEYAPRLLILDPWHAFLGERIDINRVNQVRPVFQQLANLAKECKCGMILVSHVNKRAQGENVNNSATGSTDFVNASRSAIYLIFDENDENCRIAVHTKSNYARHGRSVRFRIINAGVRWEGFSSIDRQTMEQAARERRTPFEVKRKAQEQNKTRETLIRAIIDAANPYNTVRFTYDQFREKYGDAVFLTTQPKRELDAVKNDLEKAGYLIMTGIQVRTGSVKANGFSIRRVGYTEDVEQLEI